MEDDPVPELDQPIDLGSSQNRGSGIIGETCFLYYL